MHDEWFRDLVLGLACGAASSVVIWRSLSAMRDERDVWRGRCFRLQQVVECLTASPPDREAARRLLQDTRDEQLMRLVGGGLPWPPPTSEKG